jgi:hypothetical protein
MSTYPSKCEAISEAGRNAEIPSEIQRRRGPAFSIACRSFALILRLIQTHGLPLLNFRSNSLSGMAVSLERILAVAAGSLISVDGRKRSLPEAYRERVSVAVQDVTATRCNRHILLLMLRGLFDVRCGVDDLKGEQTRTNAKRPNTHDGCKDSYTSRR